MTDERLAEIERLRDSMILTYHSNPHHSHAHETGKSIDAINELIAEVRRLRAVIKDKDDYMQAWREADRLERL